MRYSKVKTEIIDLPDDKGKPVTVLLPRRIPTSSEKRGSLASSTFRFGAQKLAKTRQSQSQDEIQNSMDSKRVSVASVGRRQYLQVQEESKRRVSWAGGSISANTGGTAISSTSIIDVQVSAKKNTTLKKSKSVGNRQDLASKAVSISATVQSGTGTSTKKKEKRKNALPKRQQRAKKY